MVGGCHCFHNGSFQRLQADDFQGRSLHDLPFHRPVLLYLC